MELQHIPTPILRNVFILQVHKVTTSIIAIHGYSWHVLSAVDYYKFPSIKNSSMVVYTKIVLFVYFTNHFPDSRYHSAASLQLYPGHGFAASRVSIQ